MYHKLDITPDDTHTHTHTCTHTGKCPFRWSDFIAGSVKESVMKAFAPPTSAQSMKDIPITGNAPCNLYTVNCAFNASKNNQTGFILHGPSSRDVWFYIILIYLTSKVFRIYAHHIPQGWSRGLV